MDAVLLGWAAGLFEGEGSVLLSNERRHLQMKMISEESIRRFHAIVGLGKVYGPYAHRSRDEYPRSPVWLWIARDADAERAVEMFFPLVSEWRQIAMYELFPDIVGEAPDHLLVRVRAVPE